MTPAGIDPAIFRFVAQYPNHCATAVPNSYMYKPIFPIDIRFSDVYILVPLDYLQVAIIGKHKPFFLQFRLNPAWGIIDVGSLMDLICFHSHQKLSCQLQVIW